MIKILESDRTNLTRDELFKFLTDFANNYYDIKYINVADEKVLYRVVGGKSFRISDNLFHHIVVVPDYIVIDVGKNSTVVWTDKKGNRKKTSSIDYAIAYIYNEVGDN